MPRRPLATTIALLTPLAASSAVARTWTDDSGSYQLEASLVAFDASRVVLKRDSDGELGQVELSRLSQADEDYVAQQEAEAASDGRPDSERQLWTLQNGLELPGRVVDYTRREVTLQRRRGKIYVNDRVFENLPAVYRKVVPLIVAEQTGAKVSDQDSLRSWLVHHKGKPQTFTVDGVMLEFANGDEYALPFFLFSEKDLALLQNGWEAWLAANDESGYDSRAELSLALRARAAQRDQIEQAQLRVAKLQLGMAAVDAGVTSLWEVTLYPGPGVSGQPAWVVSPGRDSRTATQAALAQHPGYTAGPVRRLNR